MSKTLDKMGLTLIYFDPARLLYTFEGVVDGEVKIWDEFAASEKVAWEHAQSTYQAYKNIKGGYKMVTFEDGVYIDDKWVEVLVMAHVHSDPKGYGVSDSPDLYDVDIIKISDLHGKDLRAVIDSRQYQRLEYQAIEELYPESFT